tara:strand:- start:781 stop:948 length:168 start_codon:yes stop_codon:yes gene_type:complete
MTKRNENEIIAALTHMAVSGLKGTINHYTTYDSKGTTSKKIVIEYNVENNKRETA